MTSLKAPVWTWEVPAYFFVGGVAGVAAAIACAATLAGGDRATIGAARAIALFGAAVSPLLLISDLGRPGRFLYMLRVFKLRSAMSVGAWTLIVFSGATTAALVYWIAAPAGPIVAAGLIVTDLVAATTGLVLATYTGVLLGATVLPVWAERHRTLPIDFGVSSLGAAASAVELVAGTTEAMVRVALAAAAIKTVFWLVSLARREPAVNRTISRATLLAGPLALGLRLAGLAWAPAHAAAALAALVGSGLSRFGWIEAGRADAASMRQ
ncbi:MAG TPA: NrfD/PsrC family molybdoenzyme membrane anchor subunit [Vicinamibacterales bacterium]|nr:NrfD/PsrC family molybdoenzyme membrane anchor subunit [Vicinamibacterales bacterium]